MRWRFGVELADVQAVARRPYRLGISRTKSIPHSDLLKSVSRRIVDRRVLHLIKT
jgi:hypothetical protein